MVPVVSLDIVTRGWELNGWDRGFYPEGLPLAWRLTYFANEFPAVLVPPERWREADEALLNVWAADVHDGFRFYLAHPGSALGPGVLETAQNALGAKLAGLVLEGRSLGPPADQVTRFGLIDESGRVPAPSYLPAWRIPAGSVRDLRAGGAWLRSIAAGAPGDRALLVLAGEHIDIDDLRRWRDLAWLLGFALA